MTRGESSPRKKTWNVLIGFFFDLFTSSNPSNMNEVAALVAGRVTQQAR